MLHLNFFVLFGNPPTEECGTSQASQCLLNADVSQNKSQTIKSLVCFTQRKP